MSTTRKKGIVPRVKGAVNTLRRRFNSMLPGTLNPAVAWGRCPANRTGDVTVFFPCSTTRISCGLTGIVSYRKKQPETGRIDTADVDAMVGGIKSSRYAVLEKKDA